MHEAARGAVVRTEGRGTQRFIAIGFALVLLLMVLLTLLGLSRLGVMKQRMVDLVDEIGVKIESVQEMRSLSRERFASLGQIVLLEDPFERDEETMRFHQQASAFVQGRDRLLAFDMGPEEAAVWAQARDLIQRDQSLHERVLELASNGERAAALDILLREVRPVEAALLESFNSLAAHYHRANQHAVAEAEADFRRVEIFMLSLLALVLALSLAIAWAVIRRSQQAEAALAREHEAAVAAADRLSWAASHDSLTGLLNRREMRRRLAELALGARTRGESHVLLYLDLDRFKAINDACGHLAGDEALRQVADIFQRHVRSGDLVARLGGDEFAIGLVNCDAHKAAELAEVIRRAIAGFQFSWEDRRFALGASIGLAEIAGHAGVDGLLRAADAACYAAKSAGRNQPVACETGAA